MKMPKWFLFTAATCIVVLVTAIVVAVLLPGIQILYVKLPVYISFFALFYSSLALFAVWRSYQEAHVQDCKIDWKWVFGKWRKEKPREVRICIWETAIMIVGLLTSFLWHDLLFGIVVCLFFVTSTATCIRYLIQYKDYVMKIEFAFQIEEALEQMREEGVKFKIVTICGQKMKFEIQD